MCEHRDCTGSNEHHVVMGRKLSTVNGIVVHPHSSEAVSRYSIDVDFLRLHSRLLEVLQNHSGGHYVQQMASVGVHPKAGLMGVITIYWFSKATP